MASGLVEQQPPRAAEQQPSGEQASSPVLPRPATSTSPAMREDMIANAVQFLRHPNVDGTPLARRVAFMKSKGLTSQEIDESLRRVSSLPPPPVAGAPSPHSPSALGPPMRMGPASGVGWGTLAAGAASAVVLGCGVAYAVQNYVMPWWRRRGEKARAAEEEESPERADDRAMREAILGINATQEAVLKSLGELTKEMREANSQASAR